jgi:hypothetical protein
VERSREHHTAVVSRAGKQPGNAFVALPGSQRGAGWRQRALSPRPAMLKSTQP